MSMFLKLKEAKAKVKDNEQTSINESENAEPVSSADSNDNNSQSTNIFAKTNSKSNDGDSASIEVDVPIQEDLPKPTGSALFEKRKLADANVKSGNEKLPAGNNIHKGIEFPQAPDLDAEPKERFDYLLTKLNIAVEHPTASREVLAEFHDFLIEHHEQKLLPEDMQILTRTMQNLAVHHHKNASVRKAKYQKKVATKIEKTEKIEKSVEELGDIFG